MEHVFASGLAGDRACPEAMRRRCRESLYSSRAVKNFAFIRVHVYFRIIPTDRTDKTDGFADHPSVKEVGLMKKNAVRANLMFDYYRHIDDAHVRRLREERSGAHRITKDSLHSEIEFYDIPAGWSPRRRERRHQDEKGRGGERSPERAAVSWVHNEILFQNDARIRPFEK